MANLGAYQVLPPKDWPEFERVCRHVFAKLWADPNTQLNGRTGQPQHGVDVFGKRPTAERWSGVQSKGKDDRYGQKVTAAELRREVNKAKSFTPPLGEWILATTGPADAKIQAVARAISDEHQRRGLFTVAVMGWDEIVDQASIHPELVQLLAPALAPPSTVTLDAQSMQVLTAPNPEIIQRLDVLIQAGTAASEGPANEQMDRCRALLDAHDYKAVQPLLESIRNREWAKASDALRFRITTNLGALHWGLEDAKAAGEYFLQACAFDRSGEKALTNRATGLMLLDRPAEALVAAREAVTQHPASGFALAALINIQSRVQPDAPLPNVPSGVAQDPQVLYTLADAYSMRGAWSDAERCWRTLLQQSTVPPLAYSRLGEVLMTQATSSGGRFYVGASYTEVQMEQLLEAKELMKRSWNAIKGTGLAFASLHIVQNLAALCAVLGDVREAEPALDEGLALEPNHPGLLTRKLNLLLARKDADGAKRTLSRLPQDSVPEYGLLQAMALRIAGNKDQALNVLEKFISTTTEAELANDARCLYADLVCEVDPAQAEARFNALPGAGSAAVARSTVIFARALRTALDDPRAHTYLDLARGQLGATASNRDRLMLADALSEFDEASAAIEIYDQVVSTSADSESLQEYLRCLLNLDQRQRLQQCLDKLPQSVSAKPYYQWLQGNLAYRIGDLKSARMHYETCLHTDPNRFDARLRWAQVCLQLDDRAAVAQWLVGENILHAGRRLEELLWTARLLKETDRSDDAVKVLYAARRRFPNEPLAHLSLTGAVMFQNEAKWLIGPDDAMGVDYACGLQDSLGQIKTYIIEDIPEAQLLGDEISLNSPLAQRLLGKRAGEVVTTFQNEWVKHESTLAWIKHKYVHALHDTMQNFNTRFPDHPGLIRVEMPTQGTSDERIEPMLKALQQQRGRSEQFLALYRSAALPIAMVGKALGKSTIEMWRIMIGHFKEPISTCLGSTEERDIAFALLHAGRRVIVEPLALYQLQALSLLEVADKVCGQLAVVRSTIDELHEMLEKFKRHPEAHSTLVLIDGQPRRHEVSAADIAHDREVIENLLQWVSDHCLVVPAVPKTDKAPESLAAMSKGLGDAAYDTLLAASGSDLVLLSDDGYLRSLARGEFGVAGIWIQPVLLQALRLNHIDADAYSRALASLASWRHTHLAVRVEDLQVAARLGAEVSPEFSALSAALNASRADRRSLIEAVVRFLSDLWKAPSASSGHETAITRALLDGIDPGSSGWCPEFYGALRWSRAAEVLNRRAFATVEAWYAENGLPTSRPNEPPPGAQD